ncbi:ABC transporter permease [Muricoccus aerilatus]|uniref:ABC transporter permease n=1 Tax=Muricoccus aerilatus TaxID=452982 RepID=UPI0009FD5C78|nr:ABC transporter permease [Roseomonas aerilata]
MILALRLSLRQWPVVLSFAVLAFVVLLVLAGPGIVPAEVRELAGDPWEPFGAEHLLGTDQLGRDLLARLLEGGRLTLFLASAVAVLSFVVGLALGLAAAFLGGLMDTVLSRLMDIIMALPPLILAILVIALLGNSMPVLVGVLVVFEAPRVFRLARALAMEIMTEDFVTAARLRGEGIGWILAREIAPNAVVPLVAELAMRFVFALLFLSSLSFLGLGVPPPQADWGGMARENSPALGFGLPAPIVPAAAIAAVALAVNQIADWLVAASGRRAARRG